MQSCYWAIDKLPGLKNSEKELLNKYQIATTKDLLKNTRTIEAKHNLAIKLQLPLKYIQKWTALADLGRIPSVGDRYCGLLLHCGIASVEQLSQVPFQRLHPTIKRLHIATMQSKDLTPSVAQVKQWIEEAKLVDYKKY